MTKTSWHMVAITALCMINSVSVSESQTPKPKPPRPAPKEVVLGEVTTVVEKVSVAKVNGEWIKTETDNMAATFHVDGNAKWVSIKITRMVTAVTPGGGTVEIPGFETIPSVQIATKAGRLYGLPASAGPGKYHVSISSVDVKLGPLPEQTSIVTIGKPVPDVDPDDPIIDPDDPIIDPDDPDVPPAPPVGEAPFPSPGFAVLIVREVDDNGKLPPEQKAIFTSSAVHKYCNSKCVKLSDGQPFYRSWDDDYEDAQLANVPSELREAYQKSKGKFKANTPWIGISDGKGKGYAGPLPNTVDDTLKLLKKWGGE